MRETGQITLWDIDCVFIVDDNSIIVIPKNLDDIQKINSHFEDTDFVINYHSIGGNATSLIERMEYGINHAIKLYPRYTINRYHKNLFSGFELMGEAVDDFFSPSRYFFNRSKEGANNNVDFIYHNEVADKWTVIFENNPITVTLS